MIRETAEQTIISVSGKVAAGGSATAVGSGVAGKTIVAVVENPEAVASAMSWADIGVIIGIVVAVGGLITQVYFSFRRDIRESRLHQAQMQKLGQER